ncbi:hypothetical protein [Parvibacter caecicola]|uniref:hypothetical protein n=1 Tax=Parvibacter caecicola TaxID=747645 RepID=UPI0023F08E95|nr:hypothetical protein [Parvibacter caecicola]
MKGTLYECIAYLTECDPQKQYEVKEVKKRRSLTQNAYYWAMLNKLARKLRMGDTEVHLNMLREYGVCEVMSLSMSVPAGDYFKYFDDLGVDFIDGEERRMLKVYKGSSRMDSSEFSCLIEGMREECEAQGIDVATPEEIARMSFTEPERNDYGYGY